MLSLDSSEWPHLQHAYGSAADIPGRLRDLEAHPPYETYESEPYFSLWSALCHQGDVYSASYAAVPHLARLAEESPTKVHWTILQLVACIEIARAKGRGPKIPPELERDYFGALARVPRLVAATAQAPWDDWYCAAALSAVAAAKGHVDLADAIQELDPDTIKALMKMKFGEG